jgi:hypothetical protein
LPNRAVDRRRIDQHGIQTVLFRQMVGVMPAQRTADQVTGPLGLFDQAADAGHRLIRHRRQLRADELRRQPAPRHFLGQQRDFHEAGEEQKPCR